MAAPYTPAKARATLLRAHGLLHPQHAEIRELLASGVSVNRALALYPFDFEEYVPALKVAFINPGVVKVALRLETLHKTVLMNAHSASRFCLPGAEQKWNELREAKALNPVLHVISPLGEARTSKQVNSRGSAYMLLLNMHHLLWCMGAWRGVHHSADTTEGANQRLLEGVLRSMETKYLNPLLTDIESALGKRQ